MKKLALSIVVLSQLGCRFVSGEADAAEGAARPESRPPAVETPVETAKAPTRPAPSTPPEPTTCGPGKPRDSANACNFAAGACCYDSREQACAAAGCGLDRCSVTKHRPSEASCAPPAPSSTGLAPRCGVGGTPQVATGLCPFLQGSCCYQTMETGCRAAGCTTDRCSLQKSNPPRPICEKATP